MSPPAHADPDRFLFAIPAGLAGVCVLFGLMCVAFGAMQIARIEAARSWPTTKATILTSAAYEQDYVDAEYTKRTRPALDFSYTYDVNGRKYTGANYDVTGFAESSQFETVARNYPVGTHVPVHYDPANPSNAGLTTEGSIWRYIFLAIGIAVMLVGVPFALAAIRMHRRRRTSA